VLANLFRDLEAKPHTLLINVKSGFQFSEHFEQVFLVVFTDAHTRVLHLNFEENFLMWALAIFNNFSVSLVVSRLILF